MKTMQTNGNGLTAKSVYVIDDPSYAAPLKTSPLACKVPLNRESEENSNYTISNGQRNEIETKTEKPQPSTEKTIAPQENGTAKSGADAVDFISEDHVDLVPDSGLESAASSWDRTVAEAKEHAFARLQDELKKAQDELKLRDKEVSRLSRIRSEVEAELEELTASLFQEAHNMVRAANIKQASAEKSFKESMMQIEVLTAEVSALKALVLTSTPSRPNPHLHPQLMDDSSGGLFKRHRRSPSHFNLKYGRESSPPDSPVKVNNHSLDSENKDSKENALEVDPIVHKEFLAWKEDPTVDKTDPFIARIYREDIDCCLNFTNVELSQQVRDAIESGEIFIEAVNDKAKNNFPKKCALLDTVRQCQYRLKVGNSSTCYSISHMCRNRIIAVCDFMNYLRYIQRGLVKSSVHDIYWEIVRLRKEMVLARLGLMLSS